ncbi:MAG: sigma-70 family RNA polymerase sigma factor [Verrucomicrobiales bacterium]|nr:sigma-70 family RNA polymerase sigma factor [Verrucomicrobiales bacterium]
MAEGKAELEKNLDAGYQRTRKSLIERLDDWEDQGAWDDFYRTYWRLIHRVSMRAGLSNDEAFDVVQETILTIAKQWKKGRAYDAEKGSFKSWLMNVARWRIADQYRKRKRNPAAMAVASHQWRVEDEADGRGTATIERFADPDDSMEKVWDAEWSANITKVARDRVKGQVSPKQFQIFDCYVIKEWTAEKVKLELGVSMAQVYLAKHRVGALMKKELQALCEQGF